MKKQTLALLVVAIIAAGITGTACYMFFGGDIADITGIVLAPEVTAGTVFFDLGALNSLESFETNENCSAVAIEGLDVAYVLVEPIGLTTNETTLFSTFTLGIGSSGGVSPQAWAIYNVMDLKTGDKIAVPGDVHAFNMIVQGTTTIASTDTPINFTMAMKPAVVVEGELEQYFRTIDNETSEPIAGAFVDLNIDSCTTDEFGYCMMLLNYEQVYHGDVSVIPYDPVTLNVSVGIDNPILVVGMDEEM